MSLSRFANTDMTPGMEVPVVEQFEAQRWDKAFRSAEYHLIRFDSVSPKTPVAIYWRFRASLVTGDFAGAKRFLDQMAHSCPDSFLSRFCQIQWESYQRQNLENQLVSLVGLSSQVPTHPFWQAEFYFVMGFLSNLVDEYHQSTRYLRIAIANYQASGHWGPQSAALTNLCVCYNHLNERALFNLNVAKLNELAETHQGPVTRFFQGRLEAYRLVDKEEYLEALELLRRLNKQANEFGRRLDQITIQVLLAYSQSQCQSLPLASDELSLDLPFLTAFNELEKFGILSGKTAREFSRKPIAKRLSSIHLLYLYDLICKKIEKGGDYEGLYSFAKQATQLSLKHQQALSLVDFRYYLVLALIRLGRAEQARPLLASYRFDAIEADSRPKMEKAKQLQKSLESSGTSTKESLLCLNLSESIATLSGRSISLSRTPKVMRLLETLALAQNEMTLASLFQKIYGHPFEPLQHQARIHSLLDRTRRLLGNKDAIRYRDGMLRIHPGWKVEIQQSDRKQYRMQSRQVALLERIRQSPQPLTIRDLEGGFGCNRRTLQLDLKKLAQQRLIQIAGTKKGCRYQSARAQP